jgi:hypothetical protein
MRASEILRKLADVIDAKEGNTGHSAPTEITNRPEIVSVEVEKPTDTAGIEGQAQVNTRSMVAPLQQKLDIMKRMAGLEVPTTDIAVGDKEESCTVCNCAPCACDSEESKDEMSIMKRNAGLPVFTIVAADEDEPFEG